MNDCFNRIKSYETAGDLCLDIHDKSTEFSDYRREIDLEDGIASVSYTHLDVYKRQIKNFVYNRFALFIAVC